MTLEQIRYFLALGEHTDFSKAAEIMYTSPSTISNELRLLEDELGYELIYPNSTPLRLTPAGEHLFLRFKEAYEIMDAGFTETREMVARQNGTLRVSCLVSLDADLILANTFKAFRESYPNVHFTYAKQGFDVLSTQLENEDADLVITLESKKHLFHNTNQQHLFDSTGICLFSKKHPLAKSNPQSLSDFKDETFICLTEKASPRGIDNVHTICRSYDFSCRNVILVPNLETIFFYIETGQAVALLDKSIRDVHSTEFRYIDTPVAEANVSAIALWNKQNTNPLIPAFISILEQQVEPYKEMFL